MDGLVDDSRAGQIPVIVISGPTASGKSSLAIQMAIKHDASIISADSRQIYRQLRIGTARLTEDEWQGIPHYLSGTVDLGTRFTAFDFVHQARQYIREISSGGRRTIICGGTGLYLQALIDGIFEIPQEDFGYRRELTDLAARMGPAHVYQMLEAVDPDEASRIHPHNLIRVIRALEIFHITGKPKSFWRSEKTFPLPEVTFLHIVLLPERAALYKRIDHRVEEMMQQGFLGEVEEVCRSGYRDALQQCKIFGYNELLEFIDGNISLDRVVELIRQNTRHYAKRQYTWFRRITGGEAILAFGEESQDRCQELFERFFWG